MSFSGAVKIADVTDYLVPSQACIKPLMDSKQSVKSNTSARGVVELDIDTMDSIQPGHFNQIRDVITNTNGESIDNKAMITLNDCLACSGCVTSAETVLISAQSIVQFNELLHNNQNKIIIVSISPQSLSSIAHAAKLSELQAMSALSSVLQSLGVDHVFDTGVCNDISLLESTNEFITRYKQCGNDKVQHKELLPILCSECPGWICYAEKTQGSSIIPHISHIKSPQQITGRLVKQYYSQIINCNPSDIFHCTIEPCFDKKLEAIRPEFVVHDDKDQSNYDKHTDEMKQLETINDQSMNSPEVDLVLATNELQQYLHDQHIELSRIVGGVLDGMFVPVNVEQNCLYRTIDTGGSGGYAEYILIAAAKHLFNIELDSSDIVWKQGGNIDIKEYTLVHNEQPVLRFAIAYGFRNIQNITRQIKQNRCKYDYVELMACPSGCLNGGGQIRASGDIKAQKQLHSELDQQYHEKTVRNSNHNPIVHHVYNKWLQCSVGDSIAQQQFYADWHTIDSDNTNPLSIKW